MIRDLGKSRRERNWSDSANCRKRAALWVRGRFQIACTRADFDRFSAMSENRGTGWWSRRDLNPRVIYIAEVTDLTLRTRPSQLIDSRTHIVTIGQSKLRQAKVPSNRTQLIRSVLLPFFDLIIGWNCTDIHLHFDRFSVRSSGLKKLSIGNFHCCGRQRCLSNRRSRRSIVLLGDGQCLHQSTVALRTKVLE